VAEEAARAVDRIDHEDAGPAEAREVVVVLFREPAVFGARREQGLAQEPIDREIRLAHQVPGALLPARAALLEVAQRDRPGLAHRLDEQVVVARGRGCRPAALGIPHRPATVMPSMRSVGALMP